MWSNRTVELSDPDEFVTLVPPHYSEFVVTEPGQFTARSTLIGLGGVQAQRHRERLSRIAEVEISRPGILFHTEPGPEMFLNGAEIRHGDIALFGSGEAHLSRLSGPTSWGVVTLANDDVEAMSTSHLGFNPARKSGFTVCTPPAGVLARLRSLHASAGALVEKTWAARARELEQALIGALMEITNADVQPATLARQHHHLIIRRFFEILEARGAEPLEMQAIRKATGVSDRSLRMAFQAQLGVNPTQYLLYRRMGQVRRALRQADPDSTRVTDIATEFGFWELGRFAVRYRQIFGESPSVTLRCWYPPQTSALSVVA